MKTLTTIVHSEFEESLSGILVVLYLVGCSAVMLWFAFNWGNFLTQ